MGRTYGASTGFTNWDMRSGDLREVLHDETAAYYLREIAGGFVKPRAHEILSRPN